MQPRTVILLIDDLQEWTGTEVHLLRLLKNLDPKRLRCLIAVVGRAGLASQFVAQGIPVEPLEIYRTLAPSGVWGVAKIVRLLRQERASLLVTYHTAADLLGPMAGLVARCPVISCRRDEGFTKRPIHVTLQRPLNRLLRGMISNSYKVVRAVQKIEGYPSHFNRVIHNGEDLQRFSPGLEDLRKKLDLSRGTCVITCVGLLSPIKDHLSQLAAMEQVLRQQQDCCLLIVGDGPEREALQQQARPLGDRVRFLGFQEHIPSILRASDIFLQTSLSEGFSNAILQAMACALPVVVTAVGGNPELVDDHCSILVPPGDVGAIADALIQLVEDRPLRRKIGRAGRQRTEAHFSLQAMVDNYTEAFEHFMKS